MSTETLRRSPFSRAESITEFLTEKGEAPEDLVTNTKALVKIVLNKVRTASANEAIIWNQETANAFRVTDMVYAIDLHGVATWQRSGMLAIYPGKIARSGYFQEGPGGISVPSDAEKIDGKNIHHIRTVLPGAMLDVTDQIEQGEVVLTR